MTRRLLPDFMSLATQQNAVQMKNVFSGTFVHTPKLGQLEIIHDYVVAVGPDGHISKCGPRSSDWAQQLLQDSDVVFKLPRSSFMLPTFTDLHLHAPQYLYLGTGLHLPLMEWLIQYAYKAEQRLDADPQLATTVYTALADRLVRSGTGCILGFGTIREETKQVEASAEGFISENTFAA